MTDEEWELHPDRIKTIAETAIEYVHALELEADDDRTEGMSAISYITELEILYLKLYEKYLDSNK